MSLSVSGQNMPPGPLEMWEKKNLLGPPYFYTAFKICDLFRLASFTENDTPAPGKKLFLDLRPEKRHEGWKNNSKQFLLRCCYTHFCSFGRKSRFCAPLPRCEVVNKPVLEFGDQLNGLGTSWMGYNDQSIYIIQTNDVSYLILRDFGTPNNLFLFNAFLH